MSTAVNSLEFETLHEDWMRIRISGTELVIKVKPMVVRMLDVPPGEAKSEANITIQSVTLMEGESERHEPSQDQTVRPEDILPEPVLFEMLEETVQVYYVKKVEQVVIMRPKVKMLNRTRKYDPAGYPVYAVDLAVAMTSIKLPS
jgi:hypothetical protein